MLSGLPSGSLFFQSALDQAAIVAVTDTKGIITYANSKFCELSGYSKDELIGANHRLLKSGHHDDSLFRDMYRTIARGDTWRGELCNRAKCGRLYWVDTIIVPRRAPSGKVIEYLSIRFDITRLKQTEAALWRSANIDNVTGLPNRTALMRHLTEAVAKADMTGGGLAFALLDIDDFKEINDSFGHSAGDELLQALGERLKDGVGAEANVARLGGDEFALVLQHEAGAETAEKIMDEVMSVVRRPVPIQGIARTAHASIGLALYPRDGRNHAELIKSADIALYRAKALGGDRVVMFEPHMAEAVERRMEIRHRADTGLKRDEFELFFQPQIDIRNSEISGFEALLRWRHPTDGLIAPGRFESVFEDPGLASGIGRFVLNSALEQAAAWAAQGLHFGKIAINVSASDFRSEFFVNHFLDRLETLRLTPTQFCVEVTEHMLLRRGAKRIRDALSRLHEAGVEIALDDFGTGYASLTDLINLPITRLKIDRSFVQGLGERKRPTAIVTRLIQLAHDLDIQVTAEGVETANQLAFLRAAGCDDAQGYFLSQPLPSPAAALFIQSGKSRIAA